MRIKLFDEMIRDSSNFDSHGNPLSGIQLVEFEEVKELIKDNKHQKSYINKLKKRMEYLEWKRITDKRKLQEKK